MHWFEEMPGFEESEYEMHGFINNTSGQFESKTQMPGTQKTPFRR